MFPVWQFAEDNCATLENLFDCQINVAVVKSTQLCSAQTGYSKPRSENGF